ncbi:MAG: YbgA family protein [Candidatus Thorarchaeota archaeon]
MAMDEFLKPKVIISKCIEFEHCRWNGNIIKSDLVRVLKPFIEFIPVCAEVEIGLGVPRDPVRIVKINGLKLIQPSTMKDLTDNMRNYTSKFLSSVQDADGFLLKFKSPSCGIYETKYYYDEKPGSAVIEKGPGLFGSAVIDKYPYLAIETEARLTNFRIREHWLTKLYTLRAYRAIKESKTHHNLVEFHSRNKLLFMGYNQVLMRKMGKTVGNTSKKKIDLVLQEYEKLLLEILEYPPKYTSHINVLMHVLGYFKKNLSNNEKAFFLDELEKYRAGWIPLFVLNNLISSWIVRFDQPYLKKQSYFNPYPQDLMNFDLMDTWRGRSYWKKLEKD